MQRVIMIACMPFVCMESEGLTWCNIVCKAQEKEYGLHHLDE